MGEEVGKAKGGLHTLSQFEDDSTEAVTKFNNLYGGPKTLLPCAIIHMGVR